MISKSQTSNRAQTLQTQAAQIDKRVCDDSECGIDEVVSLIELIEEQLWMQRELARRYGFKGYGGVEDEREEPTIMSHILIKIADYNYQNVE